MKKISLFTAVCVIALASCKKSGEQPSGNIIGKWQWVSSVGGLAQVSTPASTGKQEILTLNTDSTYAFSVINSVNEAGAFHIRTVANATSNNKDNVITFQPAQVKASPYSNYITLKNDTLTFATTFSWEGSVSKYVRQK